MAAATLQTQLNRNVRLTHLGALDVMGADAEKFLQGQTSTQVSLANGHFAPLTCFCTPKGRVLANAQLLRLGEEHFRLIMSASLIDMLANHLKKFAAFYRTELVVQSSLTFIGASAEAQSLAETTGVILPEHPSTQYQSHSVTVLRQPGKARWLFSVDNSSPYDELDDNDQARNAWHLEDIRSGIAWITIAQQDHFLPQMLNWEALGGISFKKGCYTGQEVVARAHFRGQVKKRLARIFVTTATPPDIGDTLVDADGKSVGEVVSCAFNEEQNVELLAVVSTKVVEGVSAAFWHDQPATLCSLPYALERLDPEQLAVNLNA
ncbi:YgfZ/GcvT domain-containing protein [Vreelandella nigrificans]|uniref:Folate-binding protein YgfZ n=1 Tax=Vreelandella nigrificans TaxID=2042704 RepID=A0A2A4HRX9_9GAMM|nr:folate-binding protein YgfZ [Halomonas nigrificans]PCF97536.1 folate-binding protein YgfZ [Halomonas nigrificans]